MKEKKSGAALAAILICVLAALIAAGAFYYVKVYVPSIDRAVEESTSYNAGNAMPQKAGERELVAESGDISVYRDGDFVIVSNGGEETEFSDWSRDFGITDTEIQQTDLDGDGTDDIIILDDEGEEEATLRRLYGLYVLCPKEDGYKVYYTNGEKWQSFFTDVVTCYLNQPDAYPDMLQFVMDINGVEVQFNTETGLALPEYRAYYTRTLTDDNGERVRLYTIRLGPAFISYDARTDTVETEMHVYAVYEDSREQDIGIITGGISVYDSGLFIANESVAFEADPELAVSAPPR